jgi:sialic acid synthase
MKMKAPKVVSEIGCNHKGSLDIAKEMIKVTAEFVGADYVKFQKRTNKELLSEEEYSTPHPNPKNSYGATYGEHREFLEFSLEQHEELKHFCEKLNIGYATSVWDFTSAKEIAALKPDFIKIPSACNLNFAVIDYLLSDYSGDIHVSLGMTNRAEEKRIIERFDDSGALDRLVLYACTSGYPVPHQDVCLLEINRFNKNYKDRVKAIGFSGHHLGIAIDVAAQTLGAEWIERHFTLDRTWKGTDHAASLEPDGFRRLVRDSRAVAESLEEKPQEILDIEKPQRTKLKRFTEMLSD